MTSKELTNIRSYESLTPIFFHTLIENDHLGRVLRRTVVGDRRFDNQRQRPAMDSSHPDDHFQSRYDNPGLKPFPC